MWYFYFHLCKRPEHSYLHCVPASWHCFILKGHKPRRVRMMVGKNNASVTPNDPVAVWKIMLVLQCSKWVTKTIYSRTTTWIAFSLYILYLFSLTFQRKYLSFSPGCIYMRVWHWLYTIMSTSTFDTLLIIPFFCSC